MNENDKYHHHLICAEIVFTHDDEGDIPNAIRTNGVLITQDRNIPVASLGKAQQIVQLNFHQRMKDEKIKVVDVVLMSFSYLGEFTKEEFHKVPEGTKLQEKVEPEKPTLTTVPDLDRAVAEAPPVSNE